MRHTPLNAELNSCNLQSPDLEVRAMARTGFTVRNAELGGDSCEVGQDRVVIGLGGRRNRHNKRLKIETSHGEDGSPAGSEQ
jgi:hypothetical protein